MVDWKSPRVDRRGGRVLTAVDRAYAEIREKVIQGSYPSKAHLDEAQLAEELGFSRTPIREALRRLSTEGILSFVPQHGAFVPTWETEFVQQLYDLRAVLEGTCAELAARRITPVALDRLRDCNAEMAELTEAGDAATLARLTELNTLFHTEIMTASGNEPLKQATLQCLGQFPVIHRNARHHEPEGMRNRLNHHAEIAEALTMHDATWAGGAMRAHILTVKYQWLLANPRQGDAPFSEPPDAG